MVLENAQSRFSYNAETGKIVFKISSGKRRAGDEAGYLKSDGYRLISCCSKWIYAHRLAWLLHFGRMPEGEIDHINGNRDDNRIANLRDVTRSQNMHNTMRKIGWHWHARAKKWQALIRVGGKRIYLGQYDKEDDAKHAYETAKAGHLPPAKPKQEALI